MTAILGDRVEGHYYIGTRGSTQHIQETFEDSLLYRFSPCRHTSADERAVACHANGNDDRCGFTLPELLMALAIVAVLMAIAIPMYGNYKDKIRVNKAVQDISHIQTVVERWALDRNYKYPDSLTDVGMDGMLDPWNTPYQYTNVSDAKGKGSARKDRNLVPINTDFDLWSNGPDKLSTPPLTAARSRDDVVRANNGRFVGPAADY